MNGDCWIIFGAFDTGSLALDMQSKRTNGNIYLDPCVK